MPQDPSGIRLDYDAFALEVHSKRDTMSIEDEEEPTEVEEVSESRDEEEMGEKATLKSNDDDQEFSTSRVDLDDSIFSTRNARKSWSFIQEALSRKRHQWSAGVEKTKKTNEGKTAPHKNHVALSQTRVQNVPVVLDRGAIFSPVSMISAATPPSCNISSISSSIRITEPTFKDQARAVDHPNERLRVQGMTVGNTNNYIRGAADDELQCRDEEGGVTTAPDFNRNSIAAADAVKEGGVLSKRQSLMVVLVILVAAAAAVGGVCGATGLCSS